jgi:hypothetical protein
LVDWKATLAAEDCVSVVIGLPSQRDLQEESQFQVERRGEGIERGRPMPPPGLQVGSHSSKRESRKDWSSVIGGIFSSISFFLAAFS